MNQILRSFEDFDRVARNERLMPLPEEPSRECEACVDDYRITNPHWISGLEGRSDPAMADDLLAHLEEEFISAETVEIKQSAKSGHWYFRTVTFAPLF